MAQFCINGMLVGPLILMIRSPSPILFFNSFNTGFSMWHGPQVSEYTSTRMGTSDSLTRSSKDFLLVSLIVLCLSLYQRLLICSLLLT